MRFLPILATASLAPSALTLSVQAGRFQQFTERFKESEDQAKVISASYLGSSGTEWLAGGGFRSDGMLVLVGTSIGPKLDIGGKAALVVGGPDHPAPEVGDWPIQLDGKGKPKLNMETGEPKLDIFKWHDPNATAFITVLDDDFKTVRGTVRLPWGAGGATSAAVAPSGEVYIAGTANPEKIAALTGAKQLDTPTLETKLTERTVYVAKLAKTLAEIEWLYFETDGGNSVMYREPYDVRTPAPGFKGLGMSAWGAGVLSCAYLIKIDPESYSVSGGTLWLSFLSEKDKPNSIWIHSVGFAGDGSVAVGGKAAASIIQTGNHLNGDGVPGGAYVALFDESMQSLRFCSAMNACGQADISNDDTYAFGAGIVDGRNLLLAVTGAAEEDRGYNDGQPAPAVNAIQAAFAGGHTDGHFLILDLGPANSP